MKRTIVMLLAGLLLFLGKLDLAFSGQPPDTVYTEVMHLGRGTTMAVAWSPNGEQIAVGGNLGVWLYTDTLADISYLEGHTNTVSSLAWSPDATKLVSASFDSTIRVWETTIVNQQLFLAKQNNALYSVAWSSDGTLIASGDSDGKVYLWNAMTGTMAGVLSDDTGIIYDIAWSHDSTQLAVANSTGFLSIWNVQAQQLITTLYEGRTEVHAVEWSPNDTSLAVARGGVVDLWETSTYERSTILRGHTGGQVTDVKWNSDGTCLASASIDHTIRLWNTAFVDDSPLILEGHTGNVESISWSPTDDRLVSVGDDNTVRLWDTISGQLYETRYDHNGSVESIAWNSDGTLLASGDLLDGKVHVWNTISGQLVNIFEGHAGAVVSLSWSLNGRLASTDTNRIRIWNISTNELLASIESRDTAIAWNPDGTILASGGHNGDVRLWNSETWQEMVRLDEHEGRINAVAWSPDGSQLASADRDGIINIFDTTMNQSLFVLEAESPVVSISWSPSGTRLISGGWFGIMTVWDVTTGQSLETTTGGDIVAWNPTQNILATSGDQELGSDILIWDTNALSLITILETNTNTITGLAWNPDGSRLASADRDGIIRIWSRE